MSKRVIASPFAPKAVGPYSQAVEANGTLYVSGQLPIDAQTGEFPEGGVKEQLVQIFKNLRHSLILYATIKSIAAIIGIGISAA